MDLGKALCAYLTRRCIVRLPAVVSPRGSEFAQLRFCWGRFRRICHQPSGVACVRSLSVLVSFFMWFPKPHLLTIRISTEFTFTLAFSEYAKSTTAAAEGGRHCWRLPFWDLTSLYVFTREMIYTTFWGTCSIWHDWCQTLVVFGNAVFLVSCLGKEFSSH